jgi:hypothetical protein
VVIKEAEEEAEATRERRAAESRQRVASEAMEILVALFAQFNERVHKQAPDDQVSWGRRVATWTSNFLSWAPVFTFIPSGAFDRSGWDVVAGASIELIQEAPRGEYTDLGAGEGHRWIEVPYMRTMGGDPPGHGIEPFALDDLQDADLAASNVMHMYQHAAKPAPIDDENFDRFCDRWMERLAMAAQGQLRHPDRLPE